MRFCRSARFIKILSILPLLLVCFTVFAQPTQDKVQMAEGLRASGKIYVVVAVLLTVLTGLILYVVSLDRKISKMEKQGQH